jgi:uncharacterized membrane protein SpoIIM required for sporulation
MNEQAITAIVGVVALIFVFWVIVKICKAITPMSKEEAIQHEISKHAAGTDEERAYALGKSAREAKNKGGCIGWIWLLIILGIIALFIFANK